MRDPAAVRPRRANQDKSHAGTVARSRSRHQRHRRPVGPLSPHAPYSLLAPHYERLFGRYARQLNPWLLATTRRIEPRPRVALDLACGPGTNALGLARVVPRVYALDLNPDFVREVRRRAGAAGRGVRARLGDMRSFELPEPADLVTCFFDAINHLPRREDLGRTLRSVFRALRPGGLFLFDVNTPWALRETWPTMKAVWKGRGWFAVARGVFFAGARRGGRAAPVSTGRGSFEIHWFVRNRQGLFRPRLELFEEVAWTDLEIRAALRTAGFRDVRALTEPALSPFTGPRGRARRFYAAVRPPA